MINPQDASGPVVMPQGLWVGSSGSVPGPSIVGACLATGDRISCDNCDRISKTCSKLEPFCDTEKVGTFGEFGLK